MTRWLSSPCAAVLALCGCCLYGCDPRSASVPASQSAEKAGGDERSAGGPWLSEVTGKAGIDLVRKEERQGSYFMPEIMGSGGGFLDYDGDARLDVVLIDASWGDGPKSAQTRVRLFRQADEGTFLDVSAQAGFEEMGGYGVGLAVGDVDNDGDADLYVTCFGPDRFFVNNGDGTFSDSSHWFDVPNPRWGSAAAFFDCDGDGFLDLYVVNYLDYFPGTTCDDNLQRPDYCGPQAFRGTHGKLYRNLAGPNEQGQVYHDMTATVGLTARAGPGLGLIARDFNGDQRPDLYVAYDQAPNPLWLQQPDGTFLDDALSRGIATSGLGQPQASMGVAWGDFNADSITDLFITNIRGEINTLYLGQSPGVFRDATAASGLVMSSLTMTGFGTSAIDFELDGDLDLLVVNGRVRREAPLAGSNLGTYWNSYAEPAQLFLNDGRARFQDVSQNCGEFHSRPEVARSLSAGDVDDDGDLDFLVTTCAGPARLWRNDVRRLGNWLRLRATDTVGNRDAIGATVTVTAGGRKFVREINPSASYLASHDPRLHFGLGENSRYDSIEVLWRDGVVEEFAGGDSDSEVVVRRTVGRAAR